MRLYLIVNSIYLITNWNIMFTLILGVSKVWYRGHIPPGHQILYTIQHLFNNMNIICV